MSFILIIISVSILVGCTNNIPSKESISETPNEKIVAFVKFLRYNIVDEGKLVETYKLNKEILDKEEYKKIWDLQRASADDYMDKNIDVYKLTINNNKALETELYIMLLDGSIFGGYIIEEIKGEKKYFTLDGLDLESFETKKMVLPIIEVNSIDKEVIVSDLFKGYLNANKKDWYFVQVSKLDREPVEAWTDFKINKINILNDNEDFFTADIGYNIKTTKESNYFAAGNGEIGNDYWINNKGNFYDVLKVGENKYAIISGYSG